MTPVKNAGRHALFLQSGEVVWMERDHDMVARNVSAIVEGKSCRAAIFANQVLLT